MKKANEDMRPEYQRSDFTRLERGKFFQEMTADTPATQPIDADKSQTANAQVAARLAQSPTAVAARYDRRIGRVVISLSSGLDIAFKPHDAQGLAGAKPAQLAGIEISPSGLGIHFPALDADLYLPALLEGYLGSRQWMAAAMGKAGGQASTAQKANAARANGRLGGRPRKVPTLDAA